MAFWVLIAYRLFPVTVGTLALNTLVNKAPGRNMGVPMPVLREVAAHAHLVVVTSARLESRLSRRRKPGSITLAAAYMNHLEYCAIAVSEIVRRQIDDETANMRYPEILAIIQKAMA